jgi:hypothetical protein
VKLCLLALATVLACGAPRPSASPATALPDLATSAAPSSAAADSDTPPEAAAGLPDVTVAQAWTFPRGNVPSHCALFDADAHLRCLVHARFRSDPRALRAALRLFDDLGVFVGQDEHRVMEDGDYRGRVVIAPVLPVGRYAVHLEQVDAALHAVDAFVTQLEARAQEPVRFSARRVPVRFFRTVGKTTPSAFVDEGALSYNVAGELNRTLESARDTLVHELFHLHDARRDAWSASTLDPVYQRIVQRCGGDQACLAPFAPHDTKVDGGIYYAFHPTSDVAEYAAELAIRFYRESNAALAGNAVTIPFKCNHEDNAAAWSALAREFFGGVDVVGDCPSAPQ